MEASPHPALCCPCCKQNSVNFAEFSLQRERPIMEASSHPALCCSCSPLVHLDRVLQVPPFQPHQPPQKKTHPARRNPNFWLRPLMPPLSPFPFSDSSCIWNTSSDSPGSFSASSSASATSSSLKEGSSWLDPSKFWLQPHMIPLLFVCFQDHLSLNLLPVFQLDFSRSVPFLQQVSFQ